MKRKGTTLIEVLLYVVIAGYFVASISIFAWDAISTKNRSDSQIQVNDAAQIAIEEIEKSIRDANSVTTPALKGESSSGLVLVYLDGSSKTFTSESSRIKMTTATNNYFITPDNVVVDEMTFLNLSRDGSLGAVQIHLKISRKNPNNLSELSASSIINSTQSLRN